MTELEHPGVSYLLLAVWGAAEAEDALVDWSGKLAQLGASEITTTIEGGDVFFRFWAEPTIEIPDDLFARRNGSAGHEFEFELAPAG